MLMPTEQQMHKAVAARDTSSDGHFFYGVITTGIFCLPSCTSRAAKPENLRFFATAQHAEEAGCSNSDLINNILSGANQACVSRKI